MLGDHFAGVGKGLNSAVAAYNRAVGSLEGRVLVTARRFVDLGVVGVGEKELAHPATVDATSRDLQSAELRPPVELALLPGGVDLLRQPATGPGIASGSDDGRDPSGGPAYDGQTGVTRPAVEGDVLDARGRRGARHAPVHERSPLR